MPPMRFDQPDNFSLTRRRKFTFGKLLRICRSGAVGGLILVCMKGVTLRRTSNAFGALRKNCFVCCCVRTPNLIASHVEWATLIHETFVDQVSCPRFTSLPEQTSSWRSYLTPKPCQCFPAISCKNYTNLSIGGSMPDLACSLKPVFRNN